MELLNVIWTNSHHNTIKTLFSATKQPKQGLIRTKYAGYNSHHQREDTFFSLSFHYLSLNPGQKQDKASKLWTEHSRECLSAKKTLQSEATGCYSTVNTSRDLKMLLTTNKWVSQSQRPTKEPSMTHVQIICYSLFPTSVIYTLRAISVKGERKGFFPETLAEVRLVVAVGGGASLPLSWSHHSVISAA